MNMMKDINVVYTDTGIHFEGAPSHQIMMFWEDPLMQEHALHLTKSTSGSHEILELGFGLGMSAQHIYDLHKDYPDYHHTIYEIHHTIAEEARKWASDKPQVTIVEKDWAEDVETINRKDYDGIFFDTHRDKWARMFKKYVVDHSLKCGGVFTYFYGGTDDVYELGPTVKMTFVKVDPKDCSYFRGDTFPCPYFIKNC